MTFNGTSQVVSTNGNVLAVDLRTAARAPARLIEDVLRGLSVSICDVGLW